ncbi:MAG: hypothetical protein O2966_05635 [Proteobacteria bacterium]|nr:hypothetical protein [Pseudomonadota bacterium]
MFQPNTSLGIPIATDPLSDFRKFLYVVWKHPNLPSPIGTKIAHVKESNNCTFGYLS